MTAENFLRDPQKMTELAAAIKEIDLSARQFIIMEVCGTHTMSIFRYGIKQLLPDNLRLISGPGCPVCVTPVASIAQAIAIARLPKMIFTSFGDMLRVPSAEDSLALCRDEGCDVRVVLSPLDALKIAAANPDREVVFFAVGFETTAPTTAMTLKIAREQKISNFRIISAHKTMPQALRSLLGAGHHSDALLCPGHVAAITGAASFDFVASKLKLPAAVSGFEPVEIMTALLVLAKQLAIGEARLVNAYPRAVRENGNPTALAALAEVFMPSTAKWRGLGTIADSGLELRAGYADFDALRYYQPAESAVTDNPGCRCGLVLRGEITPAECPLMGKVCTPDSPQGACMVSSEGSCAAYYKYTSR